MSTVAIRSNQTTSRHRFGRLVAATLVLVAVLGLSASTAHADDTFEAIARAQVALRDALEDYEGEREVLAGGLDLLFLRQPGMAAISDDMETRLATEYREEFKGIEASLVRLTQAVRGASAADKPALLEAYATWRDAQERDIANAMTIGSRMRASQGTLWLAVRERAVLLKKLVPVRKALGGLAQALQKAYRRAEEVLALDTDPARLRTEAALFLGMTYNAKTLADTMTSQKEAYERLFKEATPRERFGADVDTAKRLVKEAEFKSRDWVWALEFGVKQMSANVDEFEEIHQMLVQEAQKHIDGSNLRSLGKPFDGIKRFQDIRDVFGAMYGKLKARSL